MGVYVVRRNGVFISMGLATTDTRSFLTCVIFVATPTAFGGGAPE
jgi:hypothetical protein